MITKQDIEKILFVEAEILLRSELLKNRMKDISNITACITHAGTFHPDEVAATAILEIVTDKKLKITRVPSIALYLQNNTITDNIIIYDIGGADFVFDHHAKETVITREESGIDYAACGRVAAYFLRTMLIDKFGLNGQIIYEKLDKRIFQYIDAADTQTGDEQYRLNPLSAAISSFRPTYMEENANIDEHFREAVTFTKKFIEREILTVASQVMAKSKADEILATNNNDIVILDKFYPISEYLIDSNVKFIVYPSIRNIGQWCAATIPSSKETRNIPKVKFPEEYVTNESISLFLDDSCGAMDSGYMISIITFCHKDRFLLEACDYDDAYNACRVAISRDKSAYIRNRKTEKTFAIDWNSPSNN